VKHFSEERSVDSRVDDLTKLEELCEVAVIQLAKHQQTIRRYHAQNVSSRSFQVGDFVLQKIQTTKDHHKLSPIWEVPMKLSRLLDLVRIDCSEKMSSKFQILGMMIS
jgi:hypothetical protein